MLEGLSPMLLSDASQNVYSDMLFNIASALGIILQQRSYGSEHVAKEIAGPST